MIKKKLIRRLKVEEGENVDLDEYDTGWAQNAELRTAGEEAVKDRAAQILEENRQHLASAQELLWASGMYSVLIILQGLDAAGKDGTIRHVMSGVNPQGCRVQSFKVPTSEEIGHDFLWRYSRVLPSKGEIGIFNRSYYEDVLVVRVHPEILDSQKLPTTKRNDKFWEARYRDINAFEKHLHQNGTLILKFFLHTSKGEQKKRLLERLENEDKYWKFSAADLKERGFWDDYIKAYEIMLSKTSTKYAPWYVVPADYKWAARALIADIITTRIQALDLHYPNVSEEQLESIKEAREQLKNE
ncbi:MAG TPA: polyphosphate kinase 2 family protein [Methanomassiliicoccales archaeon]|nr:polyphosphate kinase 2 family protein [Methanomassiliicoccales archaeon]